jgi:hypothetical protein
MNREGKSGGWVLGERHFLLKRVKYFPGRISIGPLQDCEYDNRYGAWFLKPGSQNSALVKAPDPKRPKPQTKKFDVETGEDLKGE